MAILIIAFSSMATLVITVLQLVSDYRQQVDDLERRLDEVQVLLPSFAASVWTFNDRQIRLGLDALVHLPAIERAAIVTTTGDAHWSEGTPPSSGGMERTYPLLYDGRGAERQLGTLTVTASLHSIYRRLASRALALLVGNGVKTFLAAGFMLVIFHRLVTARLAGLERRMDALIPGLNLAPVAAAVPAAAERPVAGDEIDRLHDHFSSLTGQLAEAVRHRQLAEESLRQANAELSLRVRERTADLEAANLSLTETRKVAEDAAEGERRMRLELRNFLSMVSHEFRLPLSIIGAASQLLSLLTKADAVAQDEVDKISRAVARMSDLVDTCLSDGRLDGGETTLRLADIDVGALVAELCREFDSRAPGRIHLAPGADAVRIEADGALLRIALSNLLDNALKYSPPDSPVTVRWEQGSPGLILHVEDRGIGIDPDERDRIFEKYFRSIRSDGVKGAGLGLHIVRRIVDLHGGSVTVDSRIGTGTRFTLQLPPALPLNTRP